MVKVKICGMTNLRDALKAAELGADMAGFVFFEASPRHIERDKARVIIEDLPPELLKVGLFLNQDLELAIETASRCHIDIVQLHGQEPDSYCEEMAKQFKVIKSFRVKDKESLTPVSRYKNADYYLFDTFLEGKPGGTGKTFDWSLLGNIEFSKPIFLAGGLAPTNVREAVSRVRPFAVDVASGVEKSPGVKDYKLMKEFIDNAKNA